MIEPPAKPALARPRSAETAREASLSTHEYRVTCTWRGSTGVGYEAYDRTHLATAAPAEAELTLASDQAFRGDPSLLNPEQLLVLAAASCQLLAFLAVAARARVDVVSYHDEGTGVMPEDDPPVRITAITLRPHITIAGQHPLEKVERLVRIAHEECYIANSLRTEITVEPTIDFLPD
jgi:organic hydroperoxide reductase OsmC/OhrA